MTIGERFLGDSMALDVLQMTTQWEYRIETVTQQPQPKAHPGPIRREPPEARPEAWELWLARLNELGAEGWELVTERRSEDGTSFEGTFKRPKGTQRIVAD